LVSDSNIVCATPIMKKYEIELASSIAWWNEHIYDASKGVFNDVIML
jgi:hypothetical protein